MVESTLPRTASVRSALNRRSAAAAKSVVQIAIVVSGYSSRLTTKDSSRTPPVSSRDSAATRSVVPGGIDYILNRFVLLGLGVAYAHEFGNYISGGGFDHDRYGVFLYTSLSPMPAAFVDLVAGYVRKEYHFERRVSLDIQQATGFVRHVEGPTRADTHGDEFRISAYGGYDFILLRNITVGPRLGVSYKDATIDRYRESGGTGVELGYDNQNIVSLTTQAGVYASMAINTGVGVLVPQTTIEYIHEFMDDQRSVGFTFNQDLRGRRFLFQTDPPDRDYVNVAVGASMLFPGGVTGFANFRELVGYRDRTSHAVTLGVRFAF